MVELLTVNYAPFHRERSQRPRTFVQFQEMVCADQHYAGKIKGIWELLQRNPKTGETLRRIWNLNAVTDEGANQLLQRALNSSSATLPSLFNNLLITNNSGSTTLTAALAANATNVTSLSVAALPAAIPSGTTLQLGFGTGNTQNVVTSALAIEGATSISVNSFTVNATGFSIGANVVPVPEVTDNPTNMQLTANASSPLASYSGNLPTGAFTYTPTSGAGNRTALVTYTFANAVNGGSTPDGAYTDAWIVNVSSAATTNDYLAHEINTPMQCNNTNSIQANCTVKV